MKIIAEILCPNQKKLFLKVSLSRDTMTRRIKELIDDIKNTLKAKAEFIYYSIALDENNDLLIDDDLLILYN